MKRIVINGRGLGGAINGIPRYMAETVRSLDRVIGDGYRAELVVPSGTKPGFELKKSELSNCRIVLHGIIPLPNIMPEGKKPCISISAARVYGTGTVSPLFMISDP